MTLPPSVRVVAAPGSLAPREGWLGPGDPQAEESWLPVVGPACFVIWRRLAQALLDQGGALAITSGDLARTVGMAPVTGNQSGLARSLRRLARFGIAWRPREDLLVVRCQLPALDDTRMERLRPLIQELRNSLRTDPPS